MSTIAEDLMIAVLARLTGPTPVVAGSNRVRRHHRTIVPRDAAPAVHLVDGIDEPRKGSNDCRTDREFAFTVRLFVRDDEGFPAADPVKALVMTRLDPEAPEYSPYPHKARIVCGRITPDAEIADQDSLAIDMEFTFHYCAARWTLSEAAG